MAPQKYGELLGDLVSDVVASHMEPSRVAKDAETFSENGWPFEINAYRAVLLDLYYRQVSVTMMRQHPKHSGESQGGMLKTLPPDFTSPDIQIDFGRMTKHIDAITKSMNSESPTSHSVVVRCGVVAQSSWRGTLAPFPI